MGFAYSTDEGYLLNVPVESMSAFSHDPDSFLNWSRTRDGSILKGAYLPRKMYREYIQEMLKNAMMGKKDHIQLERLRDEVTEIKIKNSQATVCLQSRAKIETDKIVLAIGNPLPGDPVVESMEYIGDERYIRNPWDPGLMGNLSEHETIAFIGTGQTMVDLVTGLSRKSHRGRLLAISRKGILPLSHKKMNPYPSFYGELKNLTTISSYLRVVRKHIEIARNKNMDPRSVIDALRPFSLELWMKLPVVEKERFLRHLFRHWEIVRSRIPPASEKIINELLSSGQLEIVAGRITGIRSEKEGLRVTFTQKDRSEKSLMADHLINCKGPDLDYEKNRQPLIKNLLRAKLIACDPVHLGIDALPEGPVLTEGMPSEILFTIGPPLRGIVWESIATPEIRVQAENLSRLLVNA